VAEVAPALRLREAGVSDATRADILWHTREGMTAHYSVASRNGHRLS
jgi:hypothetical protein